MKRLTLLFIKFYQNSVSHFLTSISFLPSACRFSPNCSTYMYQAVDRYGTIKGFVLGMKRILRCHPFSQGGYDPVPKKQVIESNSA